MALCGKRRAKTFAMFTLCHGASRATWTDGRHWHLPCIAWTLLQKFVWWISWSRPTRTCPQDWYLKSCKIFERNLDKYRIYLGNLESPEKLRPNFLIFGWKKCGLLRIGHWFISTRIGAPGHHAFLRVHVYCTSMFSARSSFEHYFHQILPEVPATCWWPNSLWWFGWPLCGLSLRPCEQRR